jgi:hypothetical protein
VISQKKPRYHKKTEKIGSEGTYEANEARFYRLAEHILVLLDLPISHHSYKSQRFQVAFLLHTNPSDHPICPRAFGHA